MAPAIQYRQPVYKKVFPLEYDSDDVNKTTFQPFDTANDLVNGVHPSHNEHDPPQVEANGSEDCDAAGCEVVDDGSAMGDAPERGPCAGSEELVFSGGGWREVILKDLEEGNRL